MEKLKEEIFEFVLKNSKSKKTWSSNTAQTISETLRVSRNIVSQYLNEFVKNGQFGKVNSRPVIFFSFPEKTSGQHIFSTMDEAEKWYDNFFNFGLEQVVGSKGSLRNIISQMKAAIYYPPNGLPILLHGETGTGKSYLANYVYRDLITNEVIDERA